MNDDLIKHFGLKSMPFGKDSVELFSYGQLAEINEVLNLTVTAQTISLITGQAGVGKTTAVRSFTETLPSNLYSVIYLGHDQQGSTPWLPDRGKF